MTQLCDNFVTPQTPINTDFFDFSNSLLQSHKVLEQNKKGVGETANLAVGCLAKNVKKDYLNRTMNFGNEKGGATESLSNSARASDKIKNYARKLLSDLAISLKMITSA